MIGFFVSDSVAGDLSFIVQIILQTTYGSISEIELWYNDDYEYQKYTA